MKILIIFTVATVINVILSTVRSLCTVKCGKVMASLSNAICYGFYCWVVVLTVADFPLWEKIMITALANFVGVFAVKLVEEKARKDKMWLVTMTIKNKYAEKIYEDLEMQDIPFSPMRLENKDWTVFNCYCKTQTDTANAVNICRKYQGKISAYESQNL